MLWLALAIPDLPLAVFARLCSDETPFVVSEQQTVLACSRAALSGGILPGMRLTAARALVPRLTIHPRDGEAEARALRQLAAWALQFTPLVSLQPPHGLLLEIGGSLRLFDGLPKLLRRFRQELNALGYTGICGVAPTPTGAWLLARGGDQQPALDLETLRAQLEALPFTVLRLDEVQALALEGLGVTTLGDCLRLPRAGLARRLGPELLRQLDRALGQVPDPRRPYLPPPRFQARLELPSEVEHCEQLLFALKRLLRELCGFLRGLDSGTQGLEIELRHATGPATLVRVGLVSPTREPDYLFGLVRERLERVELRAPVRSLTLRAADIQLLAPDRPELLGDPGRPRHLWTHLLERLRARLGEDAVHGLSTRSEHRPERAWAYTTPGEPAETEDHGERPLWLLPQPVPLRMRDGRPYWHGPLILENGPERIETGWWDGQDLCRDYFIARNPKGTRLWVFRERRAPRGWFLHGLFS